MYVSEYVSSSESLSEKSSISSNFNENKINSENDKFIPLCSLCGEKINSKIRIVNKIVFDKFNLNYKIEKMSDLSFLSTSSESKNFIEGKNEELNFSKEFLHKNSERNSEKKLTNPFIKVNNSFNINKFGIDSERENHKEKATSLNNDINLKKIILTPIKKRKKKINKKLSNTCIIIRFINDLKNNKEKSNILDKNDLVTVSSNGKSYKPQISDLKDREKNEKTKLTEKIMKEFFQQYDCDHLINNKSLINKENRQMSKTLLKNIEFQDSLIVNRKELLNYRENDRKFIDMRKKSSCFNEFKSKNGLNVLNEIVSNLYHYSINKKKASKFENEDIGSLCRRLDKIQFRIAKIKFNDSQIN